MNSAKLGGFEYENSGNDVYVLQNRIYRFNGIWKKRGIENLCNRKIEHLDTVEKDGNLYQIIMVKRVERLRTSILSDSIEDIEKIKPITREFNLNADRKRFWLGRIESMDDKMMNESMPLSLIHFFKN